MGEITELKGMISIIDRLIDRITSLGITVSKTTIRSIDRRKSMGITDLKAMISIIDRLIDPMTSLEITDSKTTIRTTDRRRSMRITDLKAMISIIDRLIDLMASIGIRTTDRRRNMVITDLKATINITKSEDEYEAARENRLPGEGHMADGMRSRNSSGGHLRGHNDREGTRESKEEDDGFGLPIIIGSIGAAFIVGFALAGIVVLCYRRRISTKSSVVEIGVVVVGQPVTNSVRKDETNANGNS